VHSTLTRVTPRACRFAPARVAPRVSVGDLGRWALLRMSSDTAQILSHVPNSGIVQLPGRRFPGIVMQGDTLSNVFESSRFLLGEFKRLRDEERYYETLMFAEQLQAQLLHYEETLQRHAMELPYTVSIRERLVSDDYDIG
jgi:hypothetical protein